MVLAVEIIVKGNFEKQLSGKVPISRSTSQV